MRSKAKATNKTGTGSTNEGLSVKCESVKDSMEQGIITDPFGSWTGVPVDDAYETPIQDVDDL